MAKFSTSISERLDAGDNEYYVVATANEKALRASFSADGSPYEVDILTTTAPFNGEVFGRSNYTSALPNPPEEFTDTNSHTLGTTTLGTAAAVEVTNTSNSTIRVSGSISLLGEDSFRTVEEFLTAGEGERILAVRDGQLVSNAREASIDRLTGGVVPSEVTNLIGSNLSISSGQVNANNQPNLQDDEKQFFGTDDDFSLRFDPNVGANGTFIIRDEINAVDVGRVPRGGTGFVATEMTGEDALVSGRTLEDGETLTIEDDESFVVGGDYTLAGNATLNLNGDAVFTVV